MGRSRRFRVYADRLLRSIRTRFRYGFVSKKLNLAGEQ